MNFGSLKKNWEGFGFRPRLVLYFSGLFAIILAVGYWSLFMEFQGELEHEFDSSLFNYATDLLQNVELNSGGKADLPFKVIFSEDKIFPFPHGDALVKIYQSSFQELFSFSTDKDSPNNLSIVKKHIAQNRDNQFFNLISESGAQWRGVLMQVDDVPVPKIYFFVAVPRATLTKQENKFASIFIAGQIIILIISAFMISVLSKSLLMSLESLSNSIHEMPLNNSTFQFLVPAGPPEITVLAKLLNRLLTRIQQNLTAHQDFVAQAAHQLKTPLTIAKGHLEQLEQTVAPNLSGNLKVAVDEIDIMSGIISNLLTLVQIESGFQTFKSVEVDLLDQVMSEIDRLDYLARKKSLKFQIKCDDNDAPLTGWTTTTDPQLLSIILHNIFENAIKYASESPIEVNLIVNKTNLIVQICNQTEQIFTTFSSISLKEKFVRGDTPEPGQGLGLYIAYKIASILNINLGIQQENKLFIVSLKIPNTLNSFC